MSFLFNRFRIIVDSLNDTLLVFKLVDRVQ